MSTAWRLSSYTQSGLRGDANERTTQGPRARFNRPRVHGPKRPLLPPSGTMESCTPYSVHPNCTNAMLHSCIIRPPSRLCLLPLGPLILLIISKLGVFPTPLGPKRTRMSGKGPLNNTRYIRLKLSFVLIERDGLVLVSTFNLPR